jgi:hypothetical protein
MAFLLIIISWLFLLSLVLGLCRAARLGEPIVGLTELDDPLAQPCPAAT